MTGCYWVSYAILDSSTGAQAGIGSFELELDGAPCNAQEVMKLADRITDLSHDKGILLDRYVHVLSWSKMGG